MDEFAREMVRLHRQHLAKDIFKIIIFFIFIAGAIHVVGLVDSICKKKETPTKGGERDG